jgi:hypothetical protein
MVEAKISQIIVSESCVEQFAQNSPTESRLFDRSTLSSGFMWQRVLKQGVLPRGVATERSTLRGVTRICLQFWGYPMMTRRN